MLFKHEKNPKEQATKAMIKSYRKNLRKQRKRLHVITDEMMKTSDMEVAVMLADEIQHVATDVAFYAGEIEDLKKELKSMKSTR